MHVQWDVEHCDSNSNNPEKPQYVPATSSKAHQRGWGKVKSTVYNARSKKYFFLLNPYYRASSKCPAHSHGGAPTRVLSRSQADAQLSSVRRAAALAAQDHGSEKDYAFEVTSNTCMFRTSDFFSYPLSLMQDAQLQPALRARGDQRAWHGSG